MSEENVEFLKGWWREIMSVNPRELDVSHVDPDVVYEDEIFPDHAGEIYRGPEGMQRAWKQAIEAFEDGTTNELLWAKEGGDAVVSCHHVKGRGAGSGIEMEFDYAYLWKLRDGKVIYCKAFRDPAEALKTAGIPE